MSLLSLDQIKTLYDDLRGRIEDGGSVINFLPVDNASGSIASFPDGADNVPVKSLIAQITPVQSGSGDPAPDNIRPISGWTGANITVCGKNLADPSAKVNNANIEASGEIVASTYTLFIAPVKSGETYTITTTDATAIVFAYFSAYPSMGSVSYDGSRTVDFGSTTTKTITAPIDGYIVFRANPTFTTPQFEVGSTATDYTPFTGFTTTEVSWTDEAGTVYGGTLTYIGGGKYSLQATKGYVDLGTLSYGKWDYNNSFYTSLTGSKRGDAGATLICSQYKTANYGTQAAMASGEICINAGQTIYIKDDAYASATTADFKTAMNGVQLVYDLATLPDPIILDAEDVKTLLGDNNIFVDTGDVSVDYRADIALYIQKVVNA